MDHKAWLWRKRSSEKRIVANAEDVQPVPNQKELDLESSLEALNEKFASLLDECSAKDEVLQKYEKIAEDAIADKKKAEEETGRLRHELDEAQQQRAAANERLGHLNSALKDCMEQLNLVRNEQDQRIHDAVMKTSQELEKSHKKLEQKLLETSKRVTSLTAESSNLRKALLVKENLIEDLNNVKIQTEAEFEALMTRLDLIEKENAFLRYEFRAVEKELDLRNEEMEYSRRAGAASTKQHLENVKKIKKLEAECQRLRVLTRKRSDIEEHRRVPVNSTRRNALVVRDLSTSHSPDNTRKQFSFLIDQVQDLERENKILKECLAKKEEEVFYHRRVKNSLFKEKLELAYISNPAPDKLSSVSDNGIVDSYEINSAENDGKMIGASEMSLMDDFVEMERLAIVAIDAPVSANDWIQDVRKMILEQHSISKRSFDELLEDIKMALHSNIHPQPTELLPISGYITWKSPSSSPRSSLVQESSPHSDMNKYISKIIELVGEFGLSHAEDRNVEDDGRSKSSMVADYRIRVFGWRRSELSTVLKDFIHSCNNLLDGKIKFEQFTGDLTSILVWIVSNCIRYQDNTTVRDEFKKYLGGAGPGTALELESVQNLMFQMEMMYSAFQVEIKGLKNESNFIKSSREESEQSQHEMGILIESQRTNEDKIENLKLLNEDLDTQLTATKAKLNEVLQKLSSVEVELHDKSHCCKKMEAELQQLQRITSNRCSEDNENQEELLQTGMEITKASAKLAECEETILKLGKQLKSIGSAKELSMVDKVLSITDTSYSQRSSLRDRMLSEDHTEAYNLFPKKSNSNANAGALVVVPSKKQRGGIGFWRKLVLRRKKANCKSASIYLGK